MGNYKESSRSFATGSRDTPDICDQFLQKLGYYRKHTPQDSANLFRVVSEQHYGIQLYHQRVRTDCIEYMRENPTHFPEISGPGFHHYLNTLASPYTVGTKLELRALALLHRANVQTFEPFAGGTWFVNNQDNNEVWHVFIGRDKSFDTVYTLEYMENLAYCQALVYEILYVNVLKLPDVAYAVERMLYDPHDRTTKYSTNENDEDIAVTVDGRCIALSSKSDETECVLHNFRFCNFHNSENFGSIALFFRSHWRTNSSSNRGRGSVHRNKHTVRKPDPLLYDRDISCVRQLLSAGITPFPYKTAKSLDPHMYRNGEYDTWMEDAKMSGLTINKASVFKIGRKCFAKIRGVYKFCRIERIIEEKQLLMVRLNAHSVECVSYNDVKHVSVMRSGDYTQRRWALWNGQTGAEESTPVDNNLSTDGEKTINNFEALDVLQQQQILPEGGLFTHYYPFQYHLIPPSPSQYDLMASVHGPPAFNMGMLPESTLPLSTSGESFVGNPNLVPNYCYAGLSPFHPISAVLLNALIS
ncbi:protein ovarian tumor locus-like isoform X2 [Anopheles bellator]|uniref:protein ovarian tumor locus-like isoform X2 n=1 Tax=Anopheles bellator TaxID=139047 RepID=UPI002648CBE8|nr:protein ovarian tumor locus-like isoform X2 [Anopheles bellator]